MIRVTKLDGEKIFLNEKNIQWMEALPDTTITFLGGARIIVREKLEEVEKLIENQSLSKLAKIENTVHDLPR
jgi:flagellar protein FlbD